MSWKSFLIRPIASFIARRVKRRATRAVAEQEKAFQNLIRKAKHTAFGQDHKFERIRTAADFAQQVPLRDYEGLRPYVDRIRAGEADILWPGRPRYFAKTSGTTSGVK